MNLFTKDKQKRNNFFITHKGIFFGFLITFSLKLLKDLVYHRYFKRKFAL